MIKIAVSTNINFYKLTLPILIESLINSGIEKEIINVFISGFDSDNTYTEDGITYYEMSQNSYEYSPLIHICEKEISSEYWFLIHDTCKVGSNFKNLLYNIPESKPEKIALKNFPAMSIGLYRYDYLMTVKDKLYSIRNNDYSERSLMHWKVWGVANEDYILWQTSPQPNLFGHPTEFSILDYNSWYNTGTNRRTEYYPQLDLYKNKSNWGQNHTMTITV